jgi:hypothetical protein
LAELGIGAGKLGEGKENIHRKLIGAITFDSLLYFRTSRLKKLEAWMAAHGCRVLRYLTREVHGLVDKQSSDVSGGYLDTCFVHRHHLNQMYAMAQA